MNEKRVEITFTKEEIKRLQSILLSLKGSYLDDINHDILVLDQLTAEKAKNTDDYNFIKNCLQSTRLDLNLVNKIFKFLID